MNTPLHIIASCADRKRTGLDRPVLLRKFRSRDPQERLDRWWEALAGGAARVRAEELYVGPYWSSVRSLADSKAARKHALSTWVASAGYGLVPLDAELRNYSATFSDGADDAVVRQADREAGYLSSDWWTGLSQRRLPGKPSPRSIGLLAARDPKARLLVLGSASYISALQTDLLEALQALRSPDQLLIVCGEPGPSDPTLAKCWVRSSARLLAKVGGSLPALHARVARAVLDESSDHGLDASAVRARWQEITERSPQAMKPQRTVATDQEVKDFIRAELAKAPSLRHTRLLREFRSLGRACEQSRFRDLFLQVAQEQPA